jgi:hypothetical protein
VPDHRPEAFDRPDPRQGGEDRLGHTVLDEPGSLATFG